MSQLLLAVLELVTVTGLDGRRIDINPKFVVSVVQPKEKGTLTSQATCVLNFNDRKFLSIRESCDEVRALLKRGSP
jgi:hypothetical protein